MMLSFVTIRLGMATQDHAYARVEKHGIIEIFKAFPHKSRFRLFDL